MSNNSDANAARRQAGIIKNRVFSAIRAAQKERPEKWHLDQRTSVNEGIKMVEWLFAEGLYERSVKTAEELAQRFRVKV